MQPSVWDQLENKFSNSFPRKRVGDLVSTSQREPAPVALWNSWGRPWAHRQSRLDRSRGNFSLEAARSTYIYRRHVIRHRKTYRSFLSCLCAFNKNKWPIEFSGVGLLLVELENWMRKGECIRRTTAFTKRSAGIILSHFYIEIRNFQVAINGVLRFL